MTVSAVADAVAALTPQFSGRLIQPADRGYDDARRVHNGLIDKRPALIAQCRGAQDIADAIKLAREHSLEIAIRGGGHNVAGRAATNGGLMIDLSLMRSVAVDPAAKLAAVDGGAIWRDVNRETQVHGLATTGGVVGTTGVAGLTLGGGFGWLMPRYGMAVDNLQSADLVLADGRAVRASASENPDLFWAVRGGGGNFGVAHRLTFRLHPVGPMVMGGLVAWPIAHAKDVLRHFRDLCAKASDNQMLVAAMLTEPEHGTRIVGIASGYFGSTADAEAAFKPIKTFGTPAMDAMGPIPYVALNGLLDGAFPKGALNYWKSHFVEQMSDEVIDMMIGRFMECPMPMGQLVFEYFHGAVTRVPVADTAYAMRSPGFNVAIIGEWMDPGETERCTTWTRNTYTALQPFAGARRYLNYLDADGAEELAAGYGDNLPRLRQIKQKYDPENVFRLNVNIK